MQLTVGMLREILDAIEATPENDAMAVRFGYQPNWPLECGVGEEAGIGRDANGNRSFYMGESGRGDYLSSGGRRAIGWTSSDEGEEEEDDDDPYLNHPTYGKSVNV